MGAYLAAVVGVAYTEEDQAPLLSDTSYSLGVNVPVVYRVLDFNSLKVR